MTRSQGRERLRDGLLAAIFAVAELSVSPLADEIPPSLVVIPGFEAGCGAVAWKWTIGASRAEIAPGFSGLLTPAVPKKLQRRFVAQAANRLVRDR